MDHPHVAYLVKRYLDKNISELELIELTEMLLEDRQAPQVKAAFEQMVLQGDTVTEYNPADWESIYQKIVGQQAILPATGKLRSMNWTRWAAAAVLLAIVAAGAWYFTRDQVEIPATSNQQLATGNDLDPGRDGAILTLADGTRIILDNQQNGQITQQGNTDVVKNGGELSYQVAGEMPEQVVFNTMNTPRGRQYSLVLADGTKAWLNAASSIRYPTSFPGAARRVEITGEAYFEVAHDPSKPFYVSVNGVEVQVLGTHFNINAYTDESSLKVTLVEGKVRIASRAPVAGSQSGVLKPGQQAQVSGDNKIRIVDDADIDEVMAWKNGVFQFNNADIKTIMRQLARWYDVDIEYQGNIPVRTFHGEIDRNVPASKVLQMLEYTGIHFKIEGKKIVVIP